MKIKLFFIVSLILCLNKIVAITNVSGGIFSSTTWTLSNSPYVVTGNIVVFPGVTLNIEPGVELRINSQGSNGLPISIETRGTINILGTSINPIVVKSALNSNSKSLWKGFVIKTLLGGSLNFNYLSVSNADTVFKYDQFPTSSIQMNQCKFMDNTNVFNIFNLLGPISFMANDCSFKRNLAAMDISGATIKFNNCQFDSNGVALTNYACNVEIANCTFKNHSTALNFSIAGFSTFKVKHSQFINNTVGVLGPYYGTIDSCSFSGNGYGVKSAYDFTVKNSAFNNNVVGIEVGYASEVNNNEIFNNTVGVVLDQIFPGLNPPNIVNNKICNNTTFNIENKSDANLFIPTNCFCESDSTIIENKIFDGYDDITRGLISYAIFDTTCVTPVQIVNNGNIISNITNISSSFLVYPNPVKDALYLKDNSQYETLELSSLNGTLYTFPINFGNAKIDLSNLKSGVYLIRMINKENKSELKKIIKL